MQNESKNAKALHLKRKKTYQLIEDYHKKFIDENTQSLKIDLSENRNCPVCNSNSNLFIMKKGASSYYKCNECTMVYLNPILNEKATIDYYKNLNTGQGDTVSSESDFYNEIYTNGLKSISHFANSKKTLLDIGCSTVYFLDICKNNDWETSGIELGISEGEVAKNKGHNIYTTLINDLNPNLTFDVITMWDVLEHIPDGLSHLNIIYKYLNKGGILFFQIPNSDALAAKILREKCRMFDGIEHTNLYNPKSIEKLIEFTNFKIKSINSVISEIAVMNNFLDYTDPYFGESQFSNNKFLNILDADTIHNNKIGYKLQVILQKL